MVLESFWRINHGHDELWKLDEVSLNALILRQCLTVCFLWLGAFVLTQLDIGISVLAPARVAFNREVS